MPSDEARRWRFGWLFAAIWLGYLVAPLRALVEQSGWRRDVGLVALAAFVVVYLVTVAEGRRSRATGEPRPLATRWAAVVALLVLATAMIPGAGHQALTALVYIAAVAMMNLPTPQGLAVTATLFVLAETLPRTVPGWRDSGYGLAILLATVATYGIRVALERNQRLVEAQAELGRMAVEHERARIAADLHDILGHSLTVVAVKAELAQRLLDVDPERARTELRDVEMLCRDALADVRATALGVRGVSLAGEIAAARSALAAAHVRAELPTAADEVDGRWRELFAWTIREAVTNLVRHSRARQCQIRLTPYSVEVLDDGVGLRGSVDGSGPFGPDSQGLDGLRRRAEALGARLTVGDRTDGAGFRVLVEAP
jgi:two-component system, NarL family, sensor histidine kinase DesK